MLVDLDQRQPGRVGAGVLEHFEGQADGVGFVASSAPRRSGGIVPGLVAGMVGSRALRQKYGVSLLVLRDTDPAWEGPLQAGWAPVYRNG